MCAQQQGNRRFWAQPLCQTVPCGIIHQRPLSSNHISLPFWRIPRTWNSHTLLYTVHFLHINQRLVDTSPIASRRINQLHFPPKKKKKKGKKRGRRRRMDIFNSDAIGDECFSPWWRAHAIADDVRRRSFLGGTTVSERETHNDRYVDECTASESENRPVIFLNLAYFKLFKHGIDTSLHPH